VPVTALSGFLLRLCNFLCLPKLVSPKQASVPILVPRSEFLAADHVLDFCAASVRLFLLELFGRWQWVFSSANTSQKPQVPLVFHWTPFKFSSVLSAWLQKSPVSTSVREPKGIPVIFLFLFTQPAARWSQLSDSILHYPF
jgi:hypothetical protein